MKKICINQSNNKLNKNLSYYNNSALSIYTVDTIQHGIYKPYYSIGNVDIIIINASKITNEVFAFINDFHSNKKIIVYVDTINEKMKQLQSISTISYIVDYDINYEGIKLSKYIINNILYDKLLQSKPKQEQIIYFMDNISAIPENINSNLYPNTKLKIKLFNNPNIVNNQNLGLINENIKKQLLMESEYYAYSDDDYLCEAILCGCKILDINNSKDISYNNFIHTELPDHSTYEKLLESIL